ncbi:MAG: glycosyltransferase family 4 protein [Chloroflexota bacterium]
MYVCADTGIPLLGTKGASVHLRSLAAALAQRGHGVTLACRRLDGDNAPPPGVRVEAVPADEARQRDWLVGLIRETGAEALLERYALSTGAALTAARETGRPYILEVNAPLVQEAERYRGLTNVRQWADWERGLFRAADACIAVSTGLRDHIISAGAARERVHVVHNGVDLAAFREAHGESVRAQYRFGDEVIVGFSGSLKPWHGLDTLIEAFARVPQPAKLLIVGDGPRRPALEESLERMALASRVVLAGAMPYTDMPSYLAAMDIGVAPYSLQPRFYFSPIKVVEYLAAGLPVVASAQGDVPWLVGDAGVLVEPGQVVALTEALVLLAASRERRRRMSRAARARASQLTWDGTAAQVESVLMEAVAGQGTAWSSVGSSGLGS